MYIQFNIHTHCITLINVSYAIVTYCWICPMQASNGAGEENFFYARHAHQEKGQIEEEMGESCMDRSEEVQPTHGFGSGQIRMENISCHCAVCRARVTSIFHFLGKCFSSLVLGVRREKCFSTLQTNLCLHYPFTFLILLGVCLVKHLPIPCKSCQRHIIPIQHYIQHSKMASPSLFIG